MRRYYFTRCALQSLSKAEQQTWGFATLSISSSPGGIITRRLKEIFVILSLSAKKTRVSVQVF